MNHEDQAVNFYNHGYSCAQAVFCALTEENGMDLTIATRLSSSFGGGMGRLGETCGALTGLFMAVGLKAGYTPTDPKEIKDKFFAEIHCLGEEFRKAKGAIRCNELIDLHKTMPRPEVNGKPVKDCEHLVREAIRIGDAYFQSKATK